MMSAAKPRFREIQESDLDAIADLLTRGFVHRSRDYWMLGLRRQSMRSPPEGAPRYGYLMEDDGRPVGCLLLIYSTKVIDGEATTCCNVSSWYVDPEFRNYAALFASMTQKRKDVTYFNVTPAVPTWPILEAQGFQAYCRGLYFSLPFLSRQGRGMRIETVSPDAPSIPGFLTGNRPRSSAMPATVVSAWSAVRRMKLCRSFSFPCANAAESFPCPHFNWASAARFPISSDVPARSDAICCGEPSRSLFSTPTARSQAL